LRPVQPAYGESSKQEAKKAAAKAGKKKPAKEVWHIGRAHRRHF